MTTTRRLLGTIALTTLCLGATLVAPGAATARLAPPDGATSEIRVATFNLLGASHTDGRSRMLSGERRMRRSVEILDWYRVGVVGFQEMQGRQVAEFQRLRKRWWGLYPGAALGARNGANSIAWRKRNWTLISAHTVAIPYFGGRERQMPLLRLEQKGTGLRVWFFNTHNPVSNRKRGNHDRWRAIAVRRQIDMVNRLRRWSPHPVVVVGDFNDREKVFCPFGRYAGLHAANGGAVTSTRCTMPPKPLYVDWIFGTRDVRFHNYEALRTPYVQKTTDHPVVISRATIPLPSQR